MSIAAASRSRSTYGSTADVHGDAADRPAREPPRRRARIVLGHAGAPVAADAEPLARDHELAGLRLDALLADLRVAVPEREQPRRDARRVLAVLVERRREDQPLAGRQILGRRDELLEHAHEAVDVVQPVVLHVERVPAERRAVREEHALGARRGDVDQRADRVRAVADVDRLRLRHLGGVREVDVAVARRREHGPRGEHDLERRAVVEREGAVPARLGVPEVLELAHLVPVLGSRRCAARSGRRRCGTAPTRPR